MLGSPLLLKEYAQMKESSGHLDIGLRTPFVPTPCTARRLLWLSAWARSASMRRFRVQGSFRVWGLGFRVQETSVRVCAQGPEVTLTCPETLPEGS